jgi:multidrug transporter EmrE-like cation transporter
MAALFMSMGMVVAATVIGAFGPILLKKASQRKLSDVRSLMQNYPLMGGISLYGISTVIFILALRGGQLSVLYPLVSLGYIWVSLLSIKYLGEKMNLLKWCGILCIIIGVSFIGLGS